MPPALTSCEVERRGAAGGTYNMRKDARVRAPWTPPRSRLCRPAVVDAWVYITFTNTSTYKDKQKQLQTQTITKTSNYKHRQLYRQAAEVCCMQGIGPRVLTDHHVHAREEFARTRGRVHVRACASMCGCPGECILGVVGSPTAPARPAPPGIVLIQVACGYIPTALLRDPAHHLPILLDRLADSMYPRTYVYQIPYVYQMCRSQLPASSRGPAPRTVSATGRTPRTLYRTLLVPDPVFADRVVPRGPNNSI